MTTLPPDDMDWAALEEEFDVQPMIDSVTNVHGLDDITLLTLFGACNAELQDLSQETGHNQEMNPDCDRAREIHSLRAAARIEILRRGLT